MKINITLTSAILATSFCIAQNNLSTIENVGIGTLNPISKLTVSGSVTVNSGLTNNSLRPLISSGTLLNSEIRSYSANGYLYDDGFLRLSAGGGTNNVKSYIDLSSYSNIPDMNRNILMGTSGTERMRIDINGNIGIGTTSPIEKLNINGGIGEGPSFDPKMALTKTSSTGNIQSAKIVLNGVDSDWGNLVFKVKTTASKYELDHFYSDAMTIKGSNANVGIGTSNPDSKLTVKGNIHAQEIKVTLNAGTVPDYVFANDYKLKSLQEVEQFIKQNSHLPEIPSAKEIEKNGLMLAEMNMSLLKKVEELTLYMIEMKKENEEIKKNQLELVKRINTFENK